MECKCVHGYIGNFCHKAKCREGCHPDNGFCSKPGQCWCRPGWEGPTCETCVKYPGCQNGTCTLPWECNCTDDYVGMLCDRKASDPEPTTTKKPATVASPFGAILVEGRR